jgi:hypothetical protein
MTRKKWWCGINLSAHGYVRMITRRMAIDGEWFTVQIFKEGDGSIRVRSGT